MAQELQPRDPRKVGPYWLLGRLGGGGMGRVFLGRSPGGRLVAVKVVRAELAEQAEFRSRFAREVAAARTVSGLFTAPVVDADLDAAVPWLATAYVPGLSLADAITRHGPLAAPSVRALAAGLAEGLGAIHAAGIVHRDLKPSNVLLAEDGPRVIDFGISRAAEATTLTGTGLVFGSPAFMSPEQARGHQVGPPSDVFSLGAVLTFAATSKGPFGTGSSVTVMYRVVVIPPDTSGLPAELRPLVERCLAKDPGQRPSTDQLLAELNTAPPTAGWLPAPIIQAFPSQPPSEPGPATPTTADDLSATPVTELGAAARAGPPVSKTAGAVSPPAAAGTKAPGGGHGVGPPAHFRLGLASAAAAVALAIAYLIVAITAHLPPFSEASFAPSSPALSTTAPVSTGPRPSPVATFPATSAAPSPATSAVPSPATSAVPSPATSAAPSPATSAVPSPATSAVPSPATSAVPSPATSAAASPATSAVPSPATSAAASPAASPAGPGTRLSAPGPG